MQAVGCSPDAVSYVCILKACGNAGSLEIGEDIYAEVRKQGLLQKDVVLGTALIDMYCKCGALKKAQDLFQQLPLQNIVTWNVLISGYARHGFNIEILNCFKKIQDVGIYPDAVTYIYILKACGTIGSLDIGEAIDTKVRKQGLLQRDEVMGNALVDMYSKCGVLQKAHEVFLQLPTRNIGSWNALIAGCSHLGEADLALDLYARMVAENVVPDLITFIVLLTACSHVGLSKEGEKVFDEMCYIYCLCPTVEHYTCMVDLFGRMGYFGRVASVLDRVSHSGHLPLFLTVLGACRKWRNVRLGRWAFEQYLKLDGQCASAFVCMENIYASVGMQTEADEMKWKHLERR
jgi:pentatricopeptide repeat protein